MNKLNFKIIIIITIKLKIIKVILLKNENNTILIQIN